MLQRNRTMRLLICINSNYPDLIQILSRLNPKDTGAQLSEWETEKGKTANLHRAKFHHSLPAWGTFPTSLKIRSCSCWSKSDSIKSWQNPYQIVLVDIGKVGWYLRVGWQALFNQSITINATPQIIIHRIQNVWYIHLYICKWAYIYIHTT